MRYLVVGGIAVAFHGHPRYTKDLDVWIDLSKDNANRMLEVLSDFGFGSLGLTENDFMVEGDFVQLGYPPCRIDILNSCEGVTFPDCFERKQIVEINGLQVNFVDLEDLVRNKTAVARPQDLADVSNLRSS